MLKSKIFMLLLSTAGCSGQFMLRSELVYRDDTQALLQQKEPEIKGCYDGLLKSNPTVASKLTVHFKVEKETGKLSDIKVDAGASAPQELQQCVVNVLQNLALVPPDSADGDATFEYVFEAPAAPAAAQAPAG